MQPVAIGPEPQVTGPGSRDAAAPGKPEQNPALFQSVMAMLAGLGGPFLQPTLETEPASEGTPQAARESEAVPAGDGIGIGLSLATEDKAQASEGLADLSKAPLQQPAQGTDKAETVQGQFSAYAAPLTEQTAPEGQVDGTPPTGPPQDKLNLAMEAEMPEPSPTVGNEAGSTIQAASLGGDASKDQPSAKAPERGAKEGALPRVRTAEPTPLDSAVNGAVLNTVQGGAPTSRALESTNTSTAPPATPEEQVLQQVRISLERGENRATLQLEPRDLGKVQIEFRFQDGQLHLSLRAEQNDTGHLLNRELHALRLGLEDQGVKVGDLRVVAGSQKIWDESGRSQLFHQMKTSISSMGSDVDPRSQQQGTPFFGYGDPGQGNPSSHRRGELAPAYGTGSLSGEDGGPLSAGGGPIRSKGTRGLDLYI